MCTAVTYQTNDFYFGRTLDYESSYGEEIVIVPRQFRLSFLHMGVSAQHYAMIGTAHVAQGYPLFYDAVNEKGLCMAGLNFVGNACYASRPADRSDNVAQYELIPWILSQCSSIAEAKEKVETLCLLGTPFHEKMPAAQLHWLIADKHQAITVEATATGIQVRCPDQQSAFSGADVPPQRLSTPLPQAAAEQLFGQAAVADVQQRHGSTGASRRPILPVPLCAGGFRAGECRFRQF